MSQLARFTTCAALIAWTLHACPRADEARDCRALDQPSRGGGCGRPQGPSHELLYYWATPGSPWHSTIIAGSETTYSAPAIAVRSTSPAGKADVVAQGPNHQLLYYWATPGSSWHSTTIAGSGTTYSAPAIAVRSHRGGRCGRPGAKP